FQVRGFYQIFIRGPGGEILAVFAVGGAEYHRQVRPLLLNLPEGLDAVHLRHLDIQDHQVQGDLLHHFQGFLPVAGHVDLVAFLFEFFAIKEANAHFIVSHQDLFHRRPPLDVIESSSATASWAVSFTRQYLATGNLTMKVTPLPISLLTSIWP